MKDKFLKIYQKIKENIVLKFVAILIILLILNGIAKIIMKIIH